MGKCVILCLFVFLNFGCERDAEVVFLPLPPVPEECVEEITHLGSEGIYDFIEQAETPLAVLLSSPRCSHCQDYMPIFQEACVDYYKRVKFVKINVRELDEQEGDVCLDFYNGGIPSTHFFHEDRQVRFAVMMGGRDYRAPIFGAVEKEVLEKVTNIFLSIVNSQ